VEFGKSPLPEAPAPMASSKVAKDTVDLEHISNLIKNVFYAYE